MNTITVPVALGERSYDIVIGENLLAQAGELIAHAAKPKRAIIVSDEAVAPLASARCYREALERLASLREPVDAFFDAVLVNAEDSAVRANRYALLARLRGLFLGVADISLLG